MHATAYSAGAHPHSISISLIESPPTTTTKTTTTTRFDWYARVVSVTALGQAKMWYYKRFATPWLAKGYRYVHFVDSDVGSPANHPFDLAEYEEFLHAHQVLLGQPAVSLEGRSSTVPSSRVHPDTLFRWTAFVENGPLSSVAQR